MERFRSRRPARVEASRPRPEPGPRSRASAALDHLTLAIRNSHDAGSTSNVRAVLAILAAFLDRLGRHEPAATIAGYVLSPLTAATFPQINTAIAHLREVLGDQTYESLARNGESMTPAAVATYAYDQIDQARTELNAVWSCAVPGFDDHQQYDA